MKGKGGFLLLILLALISSQALIGCVSPPMVSTRNPQQTLTEKYEEIEALQLELKILVMNDRVKLQRDPVASKGIQQAGSSEKHSLESQIRHADKQIQILSEAKKKLIRETNQLWGGHNLIEFDLEPITKEK